MPFTDTVDLSIPACQVSNLSVGYGSAAVLQVDSLTVHGGEVVAVVGRSGIGKTTLLAAIAGSLSVSSGEILFWGLPEPASIRRKHTARTIQSFPLLHWLTVRGNMLLACKLRGVSPLRVDAILEEFAALHLADRFPVSLSGGERCRASLAQAVIAKPSLLLLDEPFTGLDTSVKKEVSEALFSFAEKNRAGVLFVTHDLHDALDLSNRVVVLGGASPAKIFRHVDTSHPNALGLVREALDYAGMSQ
jgi:ABC-type nitrate/sulfonate/bicarbonate transport system ATPase subunit